MNEEWTSERVSALFNLVPLHDENGNSLMIQAGIDDDSGSSNIEEEINLNGLNNLVSQAFNNGQPNQNLGNNSTSESVNQQFSNTSDNNSQSQPTNNNTQITADPTLYGQDPKDTSAIENIVGLGFLYNQALEAYLACGKNEDLAANFLLENPNFGL